MPKSKVMELAIKIAGKVDKTLGSSTKAANKQLATIQKAADKVSTTMTAGLAAMGTGAIAATKYFSDLGGEWQEATNQVASSTGAAGKELESLRGAMERVYADNFGEDVADVADAVALVDRNLANLDQEGLTKATEGALALRDAFEYEVEESTRAAEAIRKNFGTSVEDAFSLIAAGAQNGLDYSGELIDTINEYSSQFSKLGFTADGMFNLLQSGADSTAWNLDKVGDAIKEFSIRAIDGSDTTVSAFEDLGYSAEKIMATFAAGGEGANTAFFEVLNTLMDVDDQVKRDALGVSLFGTMWEDLGVEAMQAMADASSAAYDTQGALEQINQVKYNDLDSALQGICYRRPTRCINPLWTVCRRSARPLRKFPRRWRRSQRTSQTGRAAPFRRACRSWWMGSAILQTGPGKHTRRQSHFCHSCGSTKEPLWPWPRAQRSFPRAWAR